LDAHRRQPQRRHTTARTARPRAARPRPRQQTATQATKVDRRPGYDHDKYRWLAWQRGVKPLIAHCQIEHGSGLGRHRWVVERTFAWFA